MKKALVIFVVGCLFVAGMFVFVNIPGAADSKEVLNLKLQALDWEFRAQKADITLRRLRLQEIQAAVRKLRSQLKAFKPKEAAVKKAKADRKVELEKINMPRFNFMDNDR